MEMKEYDNALMEMAYELRECRAMAQKITGSYPEHIIRAGESLEKTMLNTDCVIGQLRSILFENRQSLFRAYMSVSEKTTIGKAT
jgi:hypothetical protein